ncbi:dTDP-4-dehydrorhamnose 3,5-epimerase family protein [Vibrio sinaloensis]|nr:dTDP-4-dehydrorhamnose 3,5-epimerase family protein [Vibrio sinaloensis]
MKKFRQWLCGLWRSVFFSEVNFGEIKGWKKHTEMVLNLVVPAGKIKFVAYDDRAQSSTYGQFYQTELSAENYCRLTVPQGVWLAFSRYWRVAESIA